MFPPKPNSYILQKSDKDWYRYLWVKLSDTTFEDFDKNKLSIITFNYDRSIEHFLFTSMRALYRESEQDCKEKLKKIPIIHVHGRLGALPWQGKNGRSYNHQINLNEVVKISGQIKIMKEQDDSPREFEEAVRILNSAELICLLGFGYNPRNLQRLKAKKTFAVRKGVWGTTKGFGVAEKMDIRDTWGVDVDLNHNEILEFLKNVIVLK